MTGFICPVCKEFLEDKGNLYRCRNNHSFDKSKYGYVNLLQTQQSSQKRHGDDKTQIKARKDFLSKGYYEFLMLGIEQTMKKYFPGRADVLDAGCGECYYSKSISDLNGDFHFYGVDISKYALEYAGKRKTGFPLAVASLFNLPFKDDSFDCVLNVFAPLACEEFGRVLKKDGIFIFVSPGKEHLYELKQAVYDRPVYNDEYSEIPAGFELKEEIRAEKKVSISGNENIVNLFNMTPYCYKTGEKDRNKLNCLPELELTFSFIIKVFVNKK